jgi:hypothetical protein
MMRAVRATKLVRASGLVLLGAILATAAIGVAAKKPLKPAKRDPDPAVSIRPTGVGLPQIGSHGTLAVGQFPNAVRAYHDSGDYARDLGEIGVTIQSFVKKQSKAVLKKARRSCGRKKKSKGASSAKCRVPQLAIVLDIDETSLSNYDELQANNFTDAVSALAIGAGSADSPPIAPIEDLHDFAQANGIATFFITGRPDLVSPATEQNLAAAGYESPTVFYKPSDAATIPFKSGKRAELEAQGYRIIANIGDQESDLAGGHADRSFKLPNPFYFIE